MEPFAHSKVDSFQTEQPDTMEACGRGESQRLVGLTLATAGPFPPICFYPKTSRKQKFSLLEKHFSGELRSVFSFPDFNPFVYLSTFTPPESNTLIQFHCTKVFPPLKAYPWRTYHNEYFLDILNTCTSITGSLETPMHGNPVFFADTSCPHPKGRGLNSM